MRGARQSIYQDDAEIKLQGVRSLIKYTTLCSYMLVPLDQLELEGHEAQYPEDIPDYGSRSWYSPAPCISQLGSITAWLRHLCRCRCEYFIFSLWAEMQPTVQDVRLYVVTNDGRLHNYPKVVVMNAEYMPSHGELTNPADREVISNLEEVMIMTYGHVVIEKACA